MYPYLISFFVFIAVATGIAAFYLDSLFNAKAVTMRLQKITSRELRWKLLQKEDQEPRQKSGFWRQAVIFLSKFFILQRLGQRLDQELTKADIPLSGGEFLAASCLGAVGIGCLFSLLTFRPGLGVIASLIGLLIPLFWLKSAKAKRLAKFNGQIGDALIIISNSLRSGYSFLQALEMVRRELPDPISREFGRTFKEINLGGSTEEALLNLAERVDSEDLDLVVTAVLIQRQVGGNLAEVLDNIAATIRERVRIQGEIRTLTAQGRMSGLIIGLLPIVLTLIMLYINPQYISVLFTTKAGIFLLAAALCGQIIGALLIKKIVNIRV